MKRLVVLCVSGSVLTGLAVWWSVSGSANPGPPSYPAPPVARPAAELPSSGAGPMPPASGPALYDPLVIAPCTLVPIREQEVSSQADGVLREVLVELGAHVAAGDVLGRLDDRQLQAQVELLEIQAASTAAEKIAQAQYDDADARVQYALKANQSGLRAVPELEYQGYLRERERRAQELQKAREERAASSKELQKARVLLDHHQVRAALRGEVVQVHKRAGEAVKKAEALFRVADCDALRVEGLCKVPQAALLRPGMPVLVEPELRGEPMAELVGHTAAINALAVAPDGRLVASASDDRTVLLWAWPHGTRLGTLPHPAEVTAVAVAADGAGYTVLTGGGDGLARLWRVGADGAVRPPVVLGPPHEGAVRAVAFDAGAARCATGGEDKRVGLWETATGRHLGWLRPEDGFAAHQGTVTALHFTPDGCLVSAARDNVLRVWSAAAGQTASGEGAGAGVLMRTYPGRTGEVARLGVSPDGRRLLFDHGEELRLLDRDGGACVGAVRSHRQGRFQGVAVFAPSGRLILTAASNGRLQLWSTPATPAEARFFRQGYAGGFHRSALALLGPFAAPAPPQVLAGAVVGAGAAPAPRLWPLRGHEVRHFVVPGASVVHAAAFAADESVCFTGGTDKVVRVWGVPAAADSPLPCEARITYVGSQVERGTDLVRLRAELPNPAAPGAPGAAGRRLRAGLYATLRAFPETAAVP